VPGFPVFRPSSPLRRPNHSLRFLLTRVLIKRSASPSLPSYVAVCRSATRCHGAAAALAHPSNSRHTLAPHCRNATSAPSIAIRSFLARASACARLDRPVTQPCRFSGSCTTTMMQREIHAQTPVAFHTRVLLKHSASLFIQNFSLT